MRVCVCASQLVAADPLAPTFLIGAKSVPSLIWGLRLFCRVILRREHAVWICAVNDLTSAILLSANHPVAFLSADGRLRRDATGGPGGCERKNAQRLRWSSRPMSRRLGFGFRRCFVAKSISRHEAD